MARVAFVMDKLLRRIGLSGRSIVPMLIGFGCTVPAVMATRTLSSDRDRKMTIMLTPFMSCSAKIPIYAVFAQAFFPKYSALVMTALYFGGILVGIVVALILNRTAFKGKAVPFVMELPNYRFPSPKSVLLLMWEKAKDFVTKAFTVIFVSSVVIWFLGAFDIRFNVVTESSESMLAMLGRLVAPIFAPLGLSDWRIATALFAGLSAKEAVVSTLAVLMNTSVESLSLMLPTLFTPVSAVAFLTFTLLYTPCVASIATIRREMNSTVKTAGIVILQCAIAWVCALAASLICNLICLI
jgi:ferrous iron transport protein B